MSLLFYIASSVNGQDEPNSALLLATRAGKRELSCRPGITRCVPQANSVIFPYNKSFIGPFCSVTQGGWILALFFFCVFKDLDSILVYKRSVNIQSCWSHARSITLVYRCRLPGYMVQLVEVQQLRGAVGGDLFCCLLTEEPPQKKDGKPYSIKIYFLLTGLHTFVIALV